MTTESIEVTLDEVLALIVKMAITGCVIGASFGFGIRTYFTFFPAESLPMCPDGLSIISDMNDGGTVKCVKE